MSRIEKDKMKSILSNIKDDVKKYYYDPDYRGINLDERFEKAQERINQVDTLAQVYAVIAQVLLDFDDSHLYFIPPETSIDVEYGYKMKIIGDKAYVYAVNPKSDAGKKDLKIGDQILMLEGFHPTKKDLWKMNYYYNVLSPRKSLKMKILRPGSSEPQDIEFDAKITQKKRNIDLGNSIDIGDLIRQSSDYGSRTISYTKKLGGTVVWKLKSFSFDPAQASQIMEDEVTKGNNLIMDLRGNGGGYVKNLEKIAGYFFDKDMKIAERRGREDKKKVNEPSMTKAQQGKTFAGKLIILIDSQSGSASEIFARFIQLEKRGIVLGDTSAGAVMQSVGRPGQIGVNNLVFYMTSVTNADVIMSDGNTIEHVGVTPDEIIIPSGADLANGRDPALARALELSGISISAEDAGKIFPDDEWKD